jgi:hypothetical protein
MRAVGIANHYHTKIQSLLSKDIPFLKRIIQYMIRIIRIYTYLVGSESYICLLIDLIMLATRKLFYYSVMIGGLLQ